MSAPDAAAAILWIGATLYAVFGGADFGAGLWDLEARGRGGRGARGVIDRSLTPVWEANHVWLIFCLVVLWTAFPEAFGAIMSTLYIPLVLAALGIVLRGAGFAFRKVVETEWASRASDKAFAISSVMTPFFMGTVIGAIACERVPATGDGDLVTSWLALGPVTIGALFVVMNAYLAAVFLTVDSGLDARKGRSEPEVEDHFLRRAVAMAMLAGAVAVLGLVALNVDAPYVFDRLFGEALGLVALSAVTGLSALGLLIRTIRRGRGSGDGGSPLLVVRGLSITAVVSVIWAWGVAQYPYLLPTSLTISDSAAPDPTLVTVFIVFGVAAVGILPALALLYSLTQRRTLGE